MSTAYLGSLSVGAALPGAANVAIAGAAGINGALPDILARLASLATFAPLPVNFGAQLSLAQGMVASVQSAIALGIPAPSIDFQIAAVAALVAELLAQVAAVNLQLDIIVDFQALLSASGLHAFAFDGAASSFGGELNAGINISAGVPSGAHCNALVLLTTSPAAWHALTQITVGG